MSDEPPLWVRQGVFLVPANNEAGEVMLGLEDGKHIALEPRTLDEGTMEHHRFFFSLQRLIFENSDWGDISFDTWRFWLKHKYGWGEWTERKDIRAFIPESWVPYKLGKKKRIERIDALMDLAVARGIAPDKDGIERVIRGERIAA